MLLAIVSVYLVAMLGLGVWAGRTRISGATDFLLAGRRLGVVLGAGALAATHFGGGAVLGGAEYGYTYGISGAWYGISTGVGLLALALFTASRFRRLALFTVPDYLAERYGGSAMRLIGAVLSLAALVGILAAQVNAAARTFGILGVGGLAAPVVATVVFVAYTAMGGLWAATISDLVQLIIATVGVAIAAAVVVVRAGEAGGLHALLEQHAVAPSYFDPVGAHPSFVLWLLVPTVMYTLIGQDFYQRLFATRDAITARRAAFAGGVILVVVSVLPAIAGMGARALAPEAIEPAEALPWVLRELMHPAAGGIILAAILAAVMSTADSLLTSATSHVVRDLWPGGHDEGGMDERYMLRLSRGVTVAVGALALVLGLALPGIVTTLIYSYTLYSAGILVPVLGGVLWKRATRAGALSAAVAGAAVAVFGLATGVHVAGIPTEIYSAAVSAVVFVAVSLSTAQRHA